MDRQASSRSTVYVVVLALLIFILAPVVILSTAVDIFPNIDIPVIAVAFQYGGLNPEEMEGRVTTIFERSLTTTVDDIEHIESTTMSGRSVIKVYLQSGASVDKAIAQLTAQAQTAIRQMPAGMQPPFVLEYEASSVPVLQLSISGDGLSEQQLADLSSNFLRIQMVSVPGISLPGAYGGKQRQVMIALDPQLLQSKGLAPLDVVTALGNQVPVLPSGTTKIGTASPFPPYSPWGGGVCVYVSIQLPWHCLLAGMHSSSLLAGRQALSDCMTMCLWILLR